MMVHLFGRSLIDTRDVSLGDPRKHKVDARTCNPPPPPKKKIINKINKWLIEVTELLTNVFVFAVICGLLFNDPFGVINTISTLISNVGEKGLAGFISLTIIILIYRR